MDLHHLPSPVWRWKHLTATVVWLLPGLGRDINSSHLKKGVECGCMVGVGRKRRYITGIIRGYTKVLWETKDNKKTAGLPVKNRFLIPTWPVFFSLGVTSSTLTSFLWFFILPLTKIASLHPDAISQFLSSAPAGYWQYPLWPDRLHPPHLYRCLGEHTPLT